MKHEPSRTLRLALRTNAVFSSACGLALTLFPGRLGTALGIPFPLFLRLVGFALFAFAFGLVCNAARAEVRRAEARLASFLDLGWVLGSALVLALRPVPLTGLGVSAILVVAVVVLACSALQLAGLRRMPAAS